MKKYGAIVSGIVAVLFMVASIAVCADIPETVSIDIIKKTKTAVTLPHKLHAVDNKLACTTCHHTNKADEKPALCVSCHDKEKDDGNKIALQGSPASSITKGAYHIKCVSCHKEEKAKNASTKAPTVCAGCHKA